MQVKPLNLVLNCHQDDATHVYFYDHPKVDYEDRPYAPNSKMRYNAITQEVLDPEDEQWTPLTMACKAKELIGHRWMEFRNVRKLPGLILGEKYPVKFVRDGKKIFFKKHNKNQWEELRDFSFNEALYDAVQVLLPLN